LIYFSYFFVSCISCSFDVLDKEEDLADQFSSFCVFYFYFFLCSGLYILCWWIDYHALLNANFIYEFPIISISVIYWNVAWGIFVFYVSSICFPYIFVLMFCSLWELFYVSSISFPYLCSAHCSANVVNWIYFSIFCFFL
jgi:hypothetical protein